MPLTQEDIDEEEQKHFASVTNAFRSYPQFALSANNRRRKDIYTLPVADKELLDKLGYKKRLDEVDNAIITNANFLLQIVDDPEIFQNDAEEDGVGELAGEMGSHTHESDGTHSHSHSHSHDRGHSHGSSRLKKKVTEFEMDKLRSTLKQFVRDWSTEGEEERRSSYGHMEEALVRHFAHVSEEDRIKLRVLVPGAGLGRLAYNIAKLGFACQGNEYSHYMLLSSHFILNRTDQINQHTLYPYIHTLSNVLNNHGNLRPITIPDVLPSDLPPNANFSLVAGDFEEIYGTESNPDEPQSGLWDAVLTCFFIDTAKNIVNYLRIIHRILAPGGVWINFGPLLWHWENNDTNDPSIELNMEEVKALAREIGFVISNERTIDTTYVNNKESMLGYVYHCSFWTATKL